MNKKIIVGVCTIITAICIALSAYFDEDENTKVDVAATGTQIIEGGTIIKDALNEEDAEVIVETVDTPEAE